MTIHSRLLGSLRFAPGVTGCTSARNAIKRSISQRPGSGESIAQWPPIAPRCRRSVVLGIICKSLRGNGLCFAVGAIDDGNEPKFHRQRRRNPGIRENRVLRICLPALHCCPQRPPGIQRRQRMEGAWRGRREADSSRSRKGIRLCLGCRSDDVLSCAGVMDSHPKLGKSMALSWTEGSECNRLR